MDAVSCNRHVWAETPEVTIFEAADFRDMLVTLLSSGDPVELDLSRVERMDTSGVQLLLAARRSGRLAVTGITPGVREAMVSIGCHELIGLPAEAGL
jgi:anti-anti-sigma regulatory factor